jgi:hypothetical protein
MTEKLTQKPIAIAADHRGFALKAGGVVEAYQGESPTFEVRR